MNCIHLRHSLDYIEKVLIYVSAGYDVYIDNEPIRIHSIDKKYLYELDNANFYYLNHTTNKFIEI